MDSTKDPKNISDTWVCQVCGYKFQMKSKVCCPKCNSSFVEIEKQQYEQKGVSTECVQNS